MSPWNRLLFGSERQIERRNILWNMAGSAVYALTSMLLGAAVTRFLGADAGGIFFFSFSTFGQQMFIVAYFGMRPIQITDTAEHHSFGEYLRLRWISCAAALLLSGGYALLFTERGAARSVLLMMALYKVLDGLADCYDSEFQRQGRLYLAGKSNAFRTLLSVAAFVAVMLLGRNLVLSCAAAVLGQAIGLLLFCAVPLGALQGVGRAVRPGSAWQLFHESKWLFLSAFLDLYIFAASKFAVNRWMSAAESGYYTTIFIPTSVINLMANFVIRPVLTALSEKRERGARKEFIRTIGEIAGLITGLTALGAAAAWAMGIPALSLLVGETAGRAIQPYRAALLEVILGGGFYALLNLLYYVLVILGAQRAIFLIYGGGTALVWVQSQYMVPRWGIPGAAHAYLSSMVLLVLLFGIAAAIKIPQDTKLSGAPAALSEKEEG